MYKCKRCGRNYERKNSNTISFCGSCRTTMARQRSKIKAVAFLGGGCQVCGYKSTIRALIFHHRDPTTKKFTIGKQILGWEVLKAELLKCDLLCLNCHAEVHGGFFDKNCKIGL